MSERKPSNPFLGLIENADFDLKHRVTEEQRREAEQIELDTAEVQSQAGARRDQLIPSGNVPTFFSTRVPKWARTKLKRDAQMRGVTMAQQLEALIVQGAPDKLPLTAPISRRSKLVPESEVVVFLSAQLPRRIHQRLSADAEAHGVSIQTYVTQLIQRGLAG